MQVSFAQEVRTLRPGTSCCRAVRGGRLSIQVSNFCLPRDQQHEVLLAKALFFRPKPSSAFPQPVVGRLPYSLDRSGAVLPPSLSIFRPPEFRTVGAIVGPTDLWLG